ncbi:ThiF family adenylyltransferase [Kitasatospora kifunensis]|uniref:DNA-binding transcriptional regulator YdaS (Cro superfamily) n=1 Tax=Kitasatospora kifunensis TaxID=58351 RepID=A0A7W7R1R5_KITKI|nr:ThiF family adenylyltransferase [Kitasatospora kifunensis]MBB4923674.1 DNA-binding transcriptional regulator YdaS (Cro superfamily) [Kitasatospora kifunensis]
MRPMLKPALSQAWRDRETLQFGTAPERAHVVDQADEQFCAFLGLLDGERDGPAVAAAAAGLGLSPSYVAQALRSLTETGLLEDALAVERALAELPPSRRELLGPDLASLSLLHPAPGAGAVALAHRAGLRVQVRGAGRVGAAVAAVLSAGGVGVVEVADQGRVLPADCAPGGIPAQEVGRPRVAAAREAVRRAAGLPSAAVVPAPRASPSPSPLPSPSALPSSVLAPPSAPASSLAPSSPVAQLAQGARAARSARAARAAQAAPTERPPDLVVIAPRDGSGAFAGDPAQAHTLMQAGVPHLYVGVIEHLGVVRPLVIPGASACGRCLAMTRTDQDAAWPRLLAQLTAEGPAKAREPACDGAVAAAVAGLAGLHALLLFDGVRPPSVDGWCEVSAIDGVVRRLRLPPHTECGCFWR